MIEWFKDVKLDDVAEWFSILSIGFVAVFTLGKLTTMQKEIEKDLQDVSDKVDRNLNPDDPTNEIIRRADCTLQNEQFKNLLLTQNEQFERLLAAHRDNMELLIRVELEKRSG
ncbi:MAG: hypothetical protein JJW03_05240 [Desulfosarcina sp.]|nr:hypothetical protein [Desulfobacterales bacterium]